MDATYKILSSWAKLIQDQKNDVLKKDEWVEFEYLPGKIFKNPKIKFSDGEDGQYNATLTYDACENKIIK